MEKYPPQLVEGVTDETERAARIGRWLVLQELGFFGIKSNLTLAKGEYNGSFNAAIRRRFHGLFDSFDGCHTGDIEIAAEMLGVFDDIYNVEASKNTKYLQDK